MAKIEIILADVRKFARRETEILPLIAPSYREKYWKTKPEREKRQELAAGFLLRKYLGVEQDEQIACGEFHKPYLASREKEFNLSHSGDYTALAFGDTAVGIDVERVRPCRDSVARRVFSSLQIAELEGLEGKERDACFTRFWTECEAGLKLAGTGFARDWNREMGPCPGSSRYTVCLDGDKKPKTLSAALEMDNFYSSQSGESVKPPFSSEASYYISCAYFGEAVVEIKLE